MIFDMTITKTGDDMKYIAVFGEKMHGLKAGEYEVEINKKFKKNTPPQRGYYHGILLIAIALQLGWEKDEVHDYIMQRFFPIERTNPITSEVITIGRSSSNFDTKEYTELIDVVRAQFLQEIELGVPPPERVTNEYAKKLREKYKNRYHT